MLTHFITLTKIESTFFRGCVVYELVHKIIFESRLSKPIPGFHFVTTGYFKVGGFENLILSNSEEGIAGGGGQTQKGEYVFKELSSILPADFHSAIHTPQIVFTYFLSVFCKGRKAITPAILIISSVKRLHSKGTQAGFIRTGSIQ